ncbi:ABC transporter permease [Faecalicatena contorta]|uniref:ABC transporter permease n=1 Tax=Faecalicatena contorta TaxID=39482 RepID=UPI0031DD4E8E
MKQTIVKKKLTTEVALLIVLVIMLIVFSILSPYFFSLSNFMKVGLYTAQMGVMAGGMTLVLLSGGIDVSVGSVMALVGIIAGLIMQSGGNTFLAVAAGILAGGVCGLANGMIITKGHVNAFITTLGTMTIIRGLAQIFSGGKTILIQNTTYNAIGRKYIFGILPLPVLIMIVVFILFWFILKYTKFGRQVYSIGGNEKSAYLSGIKVIPTYLWIYIIMGFCAGISGIMLSAQSGAGIPSAAAEINMETISAVILGGTSLSGGKGKLIGTVMGVLILAILSNGLNLLSVPSFYQEVIRGVVLIMAVIFDMMKERKKD